MKSLFVIGALLLLLASVGAPLAKAQSAAVATIEFNLPAGALGDALNLFSRRAGVTLSYEERLVQGLNTQALQGSYTPEAALQRLLQNTSLQAIAVGDGSWLIRPASTNTNSLVLGAVRVGGGLAGSESVFARASGVARVDRADIDRSGPRHASEILQATAGVFTVTNEQNPSVSVNIRGLKDFGRINMNIDGMRQNYQRSGHGQRNGEMFFDTEFLNGVEILKGAYAGQGGAVASGGVATFRTLESQDILRKADDDFGGRLRLSDGVPEWDNGQNLSGSLALAARPTDNTDVLFAYSNKNSDEYQPGTHGSAVYWGQFDGRPGYEAITNIVNGTGQDMESWLAKARWMATDSLELKLTALGSSASYGESQSINIDQVQRQYFKELYCNPPANYLVNNPNHPDWDTYCNWEYDPENAHPISNTNETKNQSYALDLHYTPGGDWLDLSGKLYSVSTQNTSITSANTYSFTTQTDTLGALLANTSRLFVGDHSITLNYGVEWFRDENKPEANSQTLTGNEIDLLTGTTPHGERSVLGSWLRADWSYKAFTLSPAVRWEQYNLQGTTGFRDMYRNQILWQFAEIPVDRTESKWLPSLGAAFDAIKSQQHHLQLFANASLGWRPPAITETLTAAAIPGHLPPMNTYPNWLLEPEQTRNAEAGVNWRFGTDNRQLNIKLAQFYNRTEDYILYATGARKPGHEISSLQIQAFYVNALNDLIFEGQELQLDFILDSYYGSLNVTHTGRNTDAVFYYEGKATPYLYYHPWAVGGPNGESPADYCPDAYYQYATGCYSFSTLYDPQVPEWTGKLTLGKRWLQNKLDTGATLTCASQTGDSYFTEMVDFTGAKQGLRDYCVTDLYTSYQLLDSLRLGVNLKNLTDREYIQAMGDDMVKSYAPGRTLTANLQWFF